MTRDEMRAVCFLAMARARYKKRYGEDWNEAAFWLQVPHIADMTAAFDALSTAGVRVVPCEATEEMRVAAGSSIATNLLAERGAFDQIFADMSAAGDLTNPPEKKP